MVDAPPPTRSARPRGRRRSWAQRAVLVLGTSAIFAGVMGAAGAAYFGLRLSQIDRVDDLEITGAVAGEPANYLLVGTDSREGLDPDLGGFSDDGQTGCDCTDTIMVLRVDPQEQTAQILSFPRDLWIPIAGQDTTARINSAHAYGEQTLIDTIEQNFGVPINHYVEIDFVGFEKLVDAVGGIPLWFDAPVRDKHTGLSIPEAACQVLDGEQARRFVRSRYLQYQDDDGDWHTDPSADLGRITRQQIFIRRAVSKAVGKGLSNPVTLNELVSAGVDNVRLDEHLDAGDLLALGRRFAAFDSEQLVGYSIPSDPHTTSAGAQVEIPSLREAEPILNIFRGLPPGTISPESIDVTVLNGTDIDGQAADAAGALAQIGFVIEEVASYSNGPVARTTVAYGDGAEAAARRLARHVTGGAALVHDDEVDKGEVVLITGSDFTTIHDQPAPEGSADDLAITTTTTTAPPSADSSDSLITPTTAAPTTSTSAPKPDGYGTGEPPAGVSCG